MEVKNNREAVKLDTELTNRWNRREWGFRNPAVRSTLTITQGHVLVMEKG